MPRPPSFIADPCAHLRGGPPGGAHPNADLGRAHALARYFGVETDPLKSDQRLVDSFNDKTDYRPLESCRAPAETHALGAMRVELQSGVAVIHPGHGEVVVPASARAIALDVTELPETDDARAAIERILPAIFRGDVALPPLQHRRCNGHPDEIGFASEKKALVYSCTGETAQRTIHGVGRALPLAVITAPRLTPLAAWTAAVLRGSENAFLVGADVPTVLAESRWVGIGASGLAVRVAHFPKLPDVLGADAPTLEVLEWAAPRRPLAEASSRRPIADLERVTRWLHTSNTEGDRRAALIVAYAATRTFFPYLAETGDGLDARLDEAMALLEADRASVRDALERYGEVLHDGHVGVGDRGGGSIPRPVGPFVAVGNDYVVSASKVDAIKPGEVLVAVEGEPIAARIARLETRASGSPQAVRWRIAYRLASARAYTLRSKDGSIHTVEVPPRAEFPAPKSAHVDAPGLVYVDLSTVRGDAVAAINERIAHARGVILDNRGYPTPAAMDVLAFVLPQTARGPELSKLDVTPFAARLGPPLSPQTVATRSNQAQGYTGPVVMLTGAFAQSWAEHAMTFFRSVKRGLVIGGPTSGANGNTTGVQLPGGYTFTFTGMHVAQPDGSRFHAVGHAPDILVEPTIADLAAGRDTVLLRAIEELTKR